MKPLPPRITKLIDERSKLMKDSDNKKETELLEEKILEMEAEVNRNKIKEHFEKYADDPGNVNLHEVWKTMGKL